MIETDVADNMVHVHANIIVPIPYAHVKTHGGPRKR